MAKENVFVGVLTATISTSKGKFLIFRAGWQSLAILAKDGEGKWTTTGKIYKVLHVPIEVESPNLVREERPGEIGKATLIRKASGSIIWSRG